MKEKLLSVIVPVYKVEAWLDRCISSIVNQSYEYLEIILVDDGSPDGCSAKCDAWKDQDNRIKVVHKQNGGLSSARNAGLDICTGEFVTFVDSDDWIEHDFYRDLMELITQHNVDIACAGRYDVEESTYEKKIGLCPEIEAVITPDVMLKRMLTWQGCDFSACDKIYRVSLWDHIRFPIGKTSEDVAALYRVVDKAKQILIYPKPLYNYFHRTLSITTVNFNSGNKDIVEFADEICNFAKSERPAILPEARYFKLKVILYWFRSVFTQPKVSKVEQYLFRTWQKWLYRNFGFALFSCKYLRWKDKVWYLLIILKMKSLVRWLVKSKI